MLTSLIMFLCIACPLVMFVITNMHQVYSDCMQALT